VLQALHWHECVGAASQDLAVWRQGGKAVDLQEDVGGLAVMRHFYCGERGAMFLDVESDKVFTLSSLCWWGMLKQHEKVKISTLQIINTGDGCKAMHVRLGHGDRCFNK